MNIWISFNYIHQLLTFCAICPNYVLMQLFPYPWKVRCRHYNTVALNAVALFPNNKDVLTHHHSLSHPRNLTLRIMILLNILSIKNLPQLSPKCFLCLFFPNPGDNEALYIAFNEVSLQSLNQEKFLPPLFLLTKLFPKCSG